MRLRDSILAATAALALFTSAASAATGFSANLSGAQEVPVVVTPALGSSTCVLNNAQTQLTVFVKFQNLTGTYTASHIHLPAPVGANAGVRFGFAPTLTNANHDGVFNGTWNSPTMTASDVSALLAGLAYVNIHSSFKPGGELRGQLLQDISVPTKSTTWGRVKSLYRGK